MFKLMSQQGFIKYFAKLCIKNENLGFLNDKEFLPDDDPQCVIINEFNPIASFSISINQIVILFIVISPLLSKIV